MVQLVEAQLQILKAISADAYKEQEDHFANSVYKYNNTV